MHCSVLITLSWNGKVKLDASSLTTLNCVKLQCITCPEVNDPPPKTDPGIENGKIVHLANRKISPDDADTEDPDK